MKISSINLNRTTPNSLNNNIGFKNTGEKQSNIDEKNNDDKYVKVSKRQHNLENWIFGILTLITIIQIIYFLTTRKPKPW